MSTTPYLIPDIYDNGIPLPNDSTACLSPPLDGSEQVPQDLFSNEFPHETDYDGTRINWFTNYDNRPAKNVKNNMEKSRKQALAAKLNREKKKKYISELEYLVKSLRENDETQRERLEFASERINSLEREMSYLKAVLQHDSQLANLLSKIPTASGLQFNSLLHCQSKQRKTANQAKRKFGNDSRIRQISQPECNRHDQSDDDAPAISCKKFQPSNVKAAPGVCLHVSEERVTIELCSECSRKAASLQ